MNTTLTFREGIVVTLVWKTDVGPVATIMNNTVSFDRNFTSFTHEELRHIADYIENHKLEKERNNLQRRRSPLVEDQMGNR